MEVSLPKGATRIASRAKINLHQVVGYDEKLPHLVGRKPFRKHFHNGWGTVKAKARKAKTQPNDQPANRNTQCRIAAAAPQHGSTQPPSQPTNNQQPTKQQSHECQQPLHPTNIKHHLSLSHQIDTLHSIISSRELVAITLVRVLL
jgi:hypothetical protein